MGLKEKASMHDGPIDAEDCQRKELIEQSCIHRDERGPFSNAVSSLLHTSKSLSLPLHAPSHLSCSSSLYMEVRTKIISRQMARPQACETLAQHVWRDVSCRLLRFICTAINCSAEVDGYR